MRRVATTSGVWLAAALVAGILALGARTALASSQSMDCPYDGWNYLGSQPSEQACQNACEAIHGEEAHGHWIESTTCCRCFFR